MENRYNEYLERSQWAPSEKFHKYLARKYLFISTKFLPEKSNKINVIEIGTGTGRIAEAAKSLGFASYTGIEPTKVLAQYTREFHGVDVKEEYLPNLSAKSDKFEMVFSLHVFEHAPSWQDAHLWAEEMLRIAKPGGIVVIACPDIRDYKNYFWDSDWSHGYPTTPRRVTQVFTDCGGETIYQGTIHLGSLNWLANLVSRFINLITPTRFLDLITQKLFKRNLVSGFKQAFIWGLTYVVIRK